MRGKVNTRKLIFSGLLIAIGVISAHLFYIPVGVAKAFPIQHTINVLSAIILGPLYAVINAFIISLLRNMLGFGTILAFPGSLIGAILAAVAFKITKKKLAAVLGEVIGTGLVGALVAFPIANFLMGIEATAFAFVIPFVISSLTGAFIGYLLIKTNLFEKIGGNFK